MLSARTSFWRRKPERRCCAGRRGEHADRRTGVPTLHDVLLTHAHADARTHLITRDRGGEEIAPRHAWFEFGEREQRWQGHRTNMQHALPVYIIELEALHKRAVSRASSCSSR